MTALTLTARSVRHSIRSIDALVTSIALPIMLLLLFVYVFGGAIAAPAGDYLDYVVPGIVVLCAAFGSASVAVSVCADMSTGVVDRFRAMDVPGAAIVAGHVAATLARNALSTAIVIGVALALGFDATASAAQWLAAAGLLLLFMTAIAWLSACFGLVTRSVEAANACAFFVMFLPYVSSAFVPTASMPAGLRAVAAHQPVTPIVETLRALLLGTPGGQPLIAVAWCVGGIVVGCATASALYRRRAA
jgi:ABC-2 type transport system permease protein